MTNSAHIKFVLFLTVLFTALTVTVPLYYFDIYFVERESQALIAHLFSLGIKDIAIVAAQILASGILGELFSRLVLKDKPGIAFVSRALRVFFWTVPGIWLWIGKGMLAPLSGTFVALWLSFAFVAPGVGENSVVTLEAHPFFFCILSVIIPQALEHFFFWSEVWYFIFPFAFALVSKFLTNLLSRRIIDESNEVPIVIVLGLVTAAVTAMIDTAMLAALYEWSTAKYVLAYIGLVLVYAVLGIVLVGAVEDIDSARLWEKRTSGVASNNAGSYKPPVTAAKAAEPSAAPEKVSSSKQVPLDSALAELNALIGMSDIKTVVRDLIATIRTGQEREKLGLKGAELPVHIVLTGNPGTGKTTVSRILAKVFNAMGLLPTANLIETDRASLVAPYVGQTAPLVNKVCDRAMGGVLFIDEAYTLAKDGSEDFGPEAIDALLKRMEDDLGKFVVIVAGYKNEMHRFIESNPGLKSRFNYHIHLRDYTESELYELALMFAKEGQYEFDEDAKKALRLLVKDLCATKDKNFANGRTVREEIFRPAVINLSKRVQKLPSSKRADKKLLMTITGADLPERRASSAGAETAAGKDSSSYESVIAELNAMIGMESVKQQVQELTNRIRMNKLRAEKGLKGSSPAIHIVLTGNPGTGKTTVSRILAKIFKVIGMLPTDKLVEADRSALVAKYVGQTAPLVQKKCDEAMGGVLFIDEAYTLANGGERDFGKEAIDTLLKRMEDDRGKFVVIVAGYKNEMHRFIESNPGLKSRFTTFIDIEDYNVDELCALADCFAEADDKVFAPDAKACVREKIEQIVANKGADFANGRTVREEVFNKAVTRMDSRLAALPVEELTADALRTILPEDIA